MQYRYLEDIVTADIAFRAEGKSLEEVFTSAAQAMLNVQLDNPESVKTRYAIPLHLTDDNLEMLFHNFLQEILYYKDAEGLLLSVSTIRILDANGKYLLDATLEGEPVDYERHELGVDVKAVTWHMFSLEQTPEICTATVVLDV